MNQRSPKTPSELCDDYRKASTKVEKEKVLNDFIKERHIPRWPYRLGNGTEASFTEMRGKVTSDNYDVVFSFYILAAGKHYYIGALIFKNFLAVSKETDKMAAPEIKYSNAVIAEMIGCGPDSYSRSTKYFREVNLNQIYSPTPISAASETSDLPDEGLARYLQRYIVVESYLYELCKIMRASVNDGSISAQESVGKRPSLQNMVSEFQRLDSEKLNQGNNFLTLPFFISVLIFGVCLAILVASIITIIPIPDAESMLSLGCCFGISFGGLGIVGSLTAGYGFLSNDNPGRFRPSEVSSLVSVDWLLQEAKEVISLETKMSSHACENSVVQPGTDVQPPVLSQPQPTNASSTKMPVDGSVQEKQVVVTNPTVS